MPLKIGRTVYKEQRIQVPTFTGGTVEVEFTDGAVVRLAGCYAFDGGYGGMVVHSTHPQALLNTQVDIRIDADGVPRLDPPRRKD